MLTLPCPTPAPPRHRPAPRLLNLGCGARFHPAWVNIDLQPADPAVHHHDVRASLPFPAAHFEVVYHSHLLEHLLPREVPAFLRECRRVLKPGGVLRVAVPDLEQIARLYLHAIDEAWCGDAQAHERLRWLMLELYDQATREQPGGAMLAYLHRGGTDLAWHRLGADGPNVRAHFERAVTAGSCWRQRLRGWLLGSWRERLLRWLLGNEYTLLQLGRFRHGGEVHHWMYDRVALRALLGAAGFMDFRCVDAGTSAIPDWDRYHLDTLPDGSAAKPDSLYVEANKP